MHDELGWNMAGR